MCHSFRFPKANHETRILVQVVYLRGHIKTHQLGSGEVGSEQKGSWPIKMLIKSAPGGVGSAARQELSVYQFCMCWGEGIEPLTAAASLRAALHSVS